MLASELWAESCGRACKGPDVCHWCGAACERDWVHDDPLPVLFSRTMKTSARNPSRPYVCQGCWLFRRRRVTVRFLNGKEFKDGQAAENWGWFVTPEEPLAVRECDYPALVDRLTSPPPKFALMLLTNGGKTALHLGTANDLTEVRADSRMVFTLNNVPHFYSVYELEAAFKGGPDGKEPGVQALLRLLPPPTIPIANGGKKPTGRPPAPASPKEKIIQRSA